MILQRGDIVLIELPFSSQAGSKIRPALIVQNNNNNTRLTNTIVVSITSNVTRAARESSQVMIELDSVEGRNTGLLMDSAITCENLVTIEQRRIIRKLGSLTPELLAKVDVALKVSLGLS